VLVDIGFKLENIYFAEDSNRLSKRYIIKNILLKKYPMLRDTIIVEAK
jgi:hypothetical protein